MQIVIHQWHQDASMTIVCFVAVQRFIDQTLIMVYLGEALFRSYQLPIEILSNANIAQVSFVKFYFLIHLSRPFAATRVFSYPPDPDNVVTRVTFHFFFIFFSCDFFFSICFRKMSSYPATSLGARKTLQLTQLAF